MRGQFIQRPGRWLALWAALVVAGFVAVQGVDRGIMAYSEHVRALDYRTYVAEASALAEMGQITEAFIPLRTAITLAPHAPEPQLLKGHLHYRRQEWEEAVAAYRRALQYGTTDIGARLNAIWSLVQLERYADAVALGEVSIRSGFNAPAMARLVGEAHVRAEQFAEAIPYIQQALEGYPTDRYLWEQLDWCAIHTGDEALSRRARNRIEQIQSRLDAVTGTGL